MRLSRTIRLLALAAFLLGLVNPRAMASWRCEGRTCGTSVWSCCCTLPGGEGDARCDTELPAPAGMAGTCDQSCACVLTVQRSGSARPTVSVAVDMPELGPAWLPCAPEVAGIAPGGLVVSTVETRGPPSRSTVYLRPALRGPPVLTSPILGS